MTIFEATGHMTVMSIDAGNLLPVAVAIRGKYPRATIILCCDDDAHLLSNPGWNKAEAAARAVGGMLATPVFGETRPEGATDFNDVHKLHGLQAVAHDIEAAAPVAPDEHALHTESSKAFTIDAHLVNLAAEDDQTDAPTFAVEKILPHGEVTHESAHGGTGKTYVALLKAALVSSGRNFGPLHVRPSRVVFISAEDSGRILRHRLRRICRAHDIDLEELRERLYLLDISNIDAALHRADRQRCLPTDRLDQIADLVERLDPGLVILDNASDLFDGDEIKRAHVRAFLRDIRTRLAGPTRAVLLLGQSCRDPTFDPA